MTLPMQAQYLLVLQSILLGAGLALFYDLLRVVRLYCRFGRAKTALCDTLFWLVLLAALFEFSIVYAAAQSRYYVLGGAAGGAAMYFLLLGGTVRALLYAVFGLFARLRHLAGRIGRRLHALLLRAGFREKIAGLIKKFAKPSSIFRRKGLK